MPGFLSKFFKSHRSQKLLQSNEHREVITTALEAAAGSIASAKSSAQSIPDGPTFLKFNASLEASQAITEAVAKFSKYMDECLSEMGFDGNLSATRQDIERRLANQAGKHPNQFLDTRQRENKNFSRQEAEAIAIAMKLSDLVYGSSSMETQKPKIELQLDGYKLEEQLHVSHSSYTTKPTTFTMVTAQSLPSSSSQIDINGEVFPLLVVAIKGSETKGPETQTDWMVNSNATPGHFHVREDALNTLPIHSQVKAHSGFLYCARAHLSHLASYLRGPAPKHILLTGHSAGGAVAALMFAQLLIGRTESEFQLDSSTKVSLITFGAPPVTSPSLTQSILNYAAHRIHFFHSICNEHDPVPRLDPEYACSLLDLHRSVYALPPLPDPALGSVPRRRTTETGEWILPPPVFYPLGRLIVLKDMNESGAKFDIQAYEVDLEAFANLLYVKLEAHKRAIYLENVNEILQTAGASTHV